MIKGDSCGWRKIELTRSEDKSIIKRRNTRIHRRYSKGFRNNSEGWWSLLREERWCSCSRFNKPELKNNKSYLWMCVKGLACAFEWGTKVKYGGVTPFVDASPKPLVTHTFTHNETYSHTIIPTHLSGGFEIELGLGLNTPNNYPSLLRLVIHFPWIYSLWPSLFPALAPSSLLLFSNTYSPPSSLITQFGQNVTVQRWLSGWLINASRVQKWRLHYASKREFRPSQSLTP